jgi:Putative Flp pilus-assembly TadE/G-like
MLKRLEHLRRDERGMSFVFIGIGFLSFMAATTLAIDVGLIVTARTQAQVSADSGALAGAVALVYNSYTDRSPGGPAVQSAVNAARSNTVVHQTASVDTGDVTFPNDPATGQPTRVRVQVYRNATRGNPLAMMISPMFGVPSANITATATAEVAATNAAKCVLPFTIPDKWIERQTPAWDPDDFFDAFPGGSALPDIYKGPDQSDATGYRIGVDVGTLLTLKAGTGNNIGPSLYFALALPGDTGADDYEWNIWNCNPSIMHLGDRLTQEPGNVTGPTIHGVEAIIALDPTAYWNGTKVVSTMNPSPRMKLVPLFDPYFWNVGKENGRNADLKAVNFLGFFVESVQGNDIKGRIVPATALLDSAAGPGPVNSFTRAIRLVE